MHIQTNYVDIVNHTLYSLYRSQFVFNAFLIIAYWKNTYWATVRL